MVLGSLKYLLHISSPHPFFPPTANPVPLSGADKNSYFRSGVVATIQPLFSLASLEPADDGDFRYPYASPMIGDAGPGRVHSA